MEQSQSIKYNYKTIKTIIEERGCKLDMTENEFDLVYTGVKSNISIISLCTHPTIVQFNNFLYSNTGLVCKNCHYEKFQQAIPGDYNLQEYKVIKGLSKFCTDLDFKISSDGCLADFSIKPKICIEDIWLPVQIKTTMKSNHGIYTFRLKSEYEDMCVICFAIEDQRVWIVNYNEVKNTKLSIGINSSTCDEYEIGTNELSTKLQFLYDNSQKYKLCDILNRLPEQMKQEHEFREFRENMFQEFTFDYPEIDSRVYDVIINKRYKVQDKVITSYLRKNKKTTSYTVHLSRSQSKYRYGDNDYYWLFLPDKKGVYILPDDRLLDADIISIENEPIENNVTVILHPYKTDISNMKYGWMNEYLYFFDNDIKRIYKLFDDISKPEIEVIDEYFQIISKSRFNGIDKKCVHNLVVRIFDNVITSNKIDELAASMSKLKIQRYCEMCNNDINDGNKSGHCEQCYAKMLFQSGKGRKVVRPSYEQLIKELNDSNYKQVAKKYGVSDNSIRKWIKMYKKHGDNTLTPQFISNM